MTARNHLIDVARAASVFVVVTFHCALYQIVLVDGRPAIVPWAPQPHGVWWTISWFVMIVPLFFVAGGFAHALSVDRAAAEGRSYADYLAGRARRLVGPLLLFGGFATVLSTMGAWLVSAPQATDLSVQFAQLLWFLATYLVIVGIAPAMVRLHDRTPWLPLLGFGALAAAVDAWSFAAGEPELRYLNLLTVWPLCHQLGIAYHRGWFRRGPASVPWSVLGATVVTIPVLVFGLGYPGSSIGLGDIPIANVLPPTIAMAVLCAGQASVLGLLERAGVASRLPARLADGLAVANALAVTTYLWHIPAIVVAGGLLVATSLLLPGLAGVLLSQPAVIVLTWAVIVAVVPLIGRLELALMPSLSEQPPRAAVPAYLLLTLGTGLVWRFGTVLHPDQPLSALGLALLGAGMAWLARAARSAAHLS